MPDTKPDTKPDTTLDPMPDTTLDTTQDPQRAANLAENPHAGQGAVMLDIGGDIGAVVLHLPATLEGAEVEIARLDGEGLEPAHAHDHAHDHEHDHEHEHEHEHRPTHRPHVAVVARPLGGRTAYSAVFPALPAGRYELSIPGEGVLVRADVVGGKVCEIGFEEH